MNMAMFVCCLRSGNRTPLHYAYSIPGSEGEEMVELLLSVGADPNVPDDVRIRMVCYRSVPIRTCPMMYVYVWFVIGRCRSERARRCTYCLLSVGADPNRHSTALMREYVLLLMQ